MPLSLYHTLATRPDFSKYALSPSMEAMVQKLVRSGLVRIDAGERRNFLNYTDTNHAITHSFSMRELYDPALAKRTQSKIVKIVQSERSNDPLPARVNRELNSLKADAYKLLPLLDGTEEQLIRLIAQCCEPIVLQLLMLEQTELFISYGHSVGDVMDIMNWKTVGANSGLQGHAIYVSCGGNPFADPETSKFPGDGFAALARLMIIAAQEIAHYSDLIRDKEGYYRGRHSANLSVTHPAEKVRAARQSDLARLQKLSALFTHLGIRRASRIERAIYFYRHHHWHILRRFVLRIAKMVVFSVVRLRAFIRHVRLLSAMPNDPYPANQLEIFFGDMHTNLAPQAEVYKHPDPNVEEAIACAEALARVPQQVVKWGHKAVRLATPSLYHIYYREVIPTCIHAFEERSSEPFLAPNRNRSALRKFRALLTRRHTRYIKPGKSALEEISPE